MLRSTSLADQGAVTLAKVEATHASASLEMVSLKSDNSEVWARGIAGEELDDSDAAIFESIIVAISDRNWSMQQIMRLLGKNEIADANVHMFAAFLHERPGARRAWAKREEQVKFYRDALHPWSTAFTSTYVETINADFAVLDQKED